MTQIVLNPVQEPLAQDTFKSLPLSPRLDTLNGKTIGLWNNEKMNAAKFLEAIRGELEKTYSFEVLRGTYDPGSLMPKDAWGNIEECDAVILCNGDCGACSTSGIVNAIELEKRGIPTLLVITPPFIEAVKTNARLRGMSAIRWAVVDHPIASLTEDELRERAKVVMSQFPDIMLRTAQRSAAE